MSLPQFRLLRPRVLDEALGWLATHASNIRVLSGGTDLIPSMRQKLFEPKYVLDLHDMSELRGIHTQSDGAVEIGALTTLSAIEKSPYLRQHFSVLTEAAATVASPVLRNMGTIGGNICLDTRCLWYNQSLTWRKGCGFRCWAVRRDATAPGWSADSFSGALEIRIQRY